MPVLAQHDLRDPVAFGAQGERTAADLLRDAAKVAAALPAPSAGSHVLLVFRNDRYAFAAGLLGAWARGHAVALPQDTGRENVLLLAEREDTAAILHDTSSGAPLRVDTLLAEPDQTVTPLTPAQLLGPDRVATLFSSGSNGALRGWVKRQDQLLAEARALAAALELPARARVGATIPAGHWFGLVLSVLVPLTEGGAFLREQPRGSEALSAALREAGAQVWVSVPAHLRALASSPPGAHLSHVVSSLAPLPADLARGLEQQLGARVWETFGATETGAIGVRRCPNDAQLRPLPGVHPRAGSEGELWLESPYLSPALSRPYRTRDLAEVDADERFVPLGRADDRVETDAGSVSLAAVEAALAGLPEVRAAAVLATPATPQQAAQILALAVTPGATAGTLERALAQRLAAGQLPRRILPVEALPQDECGKRPRAQLLRMFGLRPDGQPVNYTLSWQDERAERDAALERRTFRVHVPADYGYFEGHFPGYPILPGAAQLSELVLPSVRRARSDLGPLVQLTRLKFLGRIQPNETVEVVVSFRPGDLAVDFVLRRGETICAAGLLTFRAPPG